MNKIAIIFDFDETIVEESTSAYLESFGLNIDHFWQKTVGSLIEQDWDPVPAYMFRMIEASMEYPMTQESLIEFSKEVNYKKGVLDFFPTILQHVSKNYPNWEVEFYMISSGIGDIIRHTEIAKYFKDIWASDFEYDSEGALAFPKKVLSFTDKTRYLFQISKGMVGQEYRNKPYVVNEKYDSDEYIVPLSNMIYVGDGLTDIPCFSLMKKHKGAAIAVYDASNTQAYGKAWKFIEENRVSNLHSANFEEGSDLYNSIVMAINSITEKL